MLNNILKIVLAILFALCLLKMPYGYFQFVRFSALIGFVLLAYNAKDKQNKTELIIFICLALLFQPLFKIPLGRQIWNIVDVIVGISLIVSIYLSNKKSNN